MADRPDLVFRRFDDASAHSMRDTVEAVYRDAYAEAIRNNDPLDSPGPFMQRFDAYARIPAFRLVIAYSEDIPVGQIWGWPLSVSTGWWKSLIEEPEPGFTREDGTRTFALSELMLRQAWTRQGIARALHDKLLSRRNESRATLLADPNYVPAYNAYLSWGWQKTAQLRRPWPDAPLFDVLIRPLPI